MHHGIRVVAWLHARARGQQSRDVFDTCLDLKGWSLVAKRLVIVGAAEGGASKKCVWGSVVCRILSVRRRRENFDHMQQCEHFHAYSVGVFPPLPRTPCHGFLDFLRNLGGPFLNVRFS